MNKPINIFIPAAGLGERLRPITLHIPKPLLPVLGKPVLQHVLERVSALQCNKIAINLHHKKEVVENWIGQSSFSERVIFFHEDIILGTGGALKNAEAFLKEGTFLVHNSDILSDIDLERLIEHHLSSGDLVTLAVHDHPEFNNVIVDDNGFFKGIGKIPPDHPLSKGGRKSRVAFTGIAVYGPDFLQFLPSGASSVVDAWLKAVSAGRRVGTFDVSSSGFETSHYWSDIGTPEAYTRTVFDALRSAGETVYIHPSVKGCGNIEMQGYVVIEEGCILIKDVSLRNCIILPGSEVEKIVPPPIPVTRGGVKREVFENFIFGAGFRIDLTESDIFGTSAEDGRQVISAGGSDRKYYRVKRGRGSAVLMQCRRDDPDFHRQIEYTKFFQKQTVPVPEVIEIDLDEKQAVFEDAGDTSLYNWLKCPREEAEIEDIYRRTIDVLLLIHTTATDHVVLCPMLKSRIFDHEYFRWETDYFIERFVEGIRDIKAGNIPELADELDALAFKADSFPKTIIHRDFQSQNIMVLHEGRLQIIDYQGARMGPSAYDVASILWDPYYRLEDNMRERLVNYYISKIEDKFDADYFRETLLVCRLQRHMQALGAYGFLSSVKGKKYFLKYIPEGLRLLKEDIAFFKDEYPVLYELIKRL